MNEMTAYGDGTSHAMERSSPDFSNGTPRVRPSEVRLIGPD